LLALGGATWLPLAWSQPGMEIVALFGLATTLLLCKSLSMAPVLRAFIAPVPALVSLPLPGIDARPAIAGAMFAACGYLVFTLVRRAAHAFRYHGHHRYYGQHAPGGSREGRSADRFPLLREHTHARHRPRPARRVLCSASLHEAGIRMGFAHGGDIVDFGELDAVRARDYDLIVPLTIPALLRAHELGLAAGNPLPIPSPACIALCDDKLRFHQALAMHGFNELLPPLASHGEFPSVLKKRVDEWGAHAHVLLDEEDERSHAGLLGDPDYFRQAYVPGRREYASHLLARGGRILRSLTVEYRFDHDHHVKGRLRPPRGTRLVASRHLGDFAAMLAAIGFEGLCCVNYKLDGARPQVLEINPRFGASLAPYLFSFLRCLD
jgi:hypothetical protein